MSGLSPQEVADHAGVDLAYVTTLIERGVLRPSDDGTFTEGDTRRTRVYQGLERAGLPLDALIEALDRGELSLSILDLPVYDRIARVSTSTFREVSEREGIPLDLLLVLRETIGFAQAEPDDRMREDELQVVPIVRLQVSLGFDPAVIERWLRVYADALRRITETEADWWHTQISAPNLAKGMSQAEMLAATNEIGWEVATLTEQALMGIYHAHQEHTWTESLIGEVEDALDRAGLWDRIVAPPAICFLDITGYTRMTEERGDRAAAELAARLTPLVQRPAERHGGKVVKWLGDGVMFHFREPTGGVRAALEMLEAIDRADLPPAHVGLQTGPVVFQGGDYFGRTVNVAARIAEHAGPGQLLVSRDVVEAVRLDDVAFTDVGPAELKGVTDPVTLFRAGRTT